MQARDLPHDYTHPDDYDDPTATWVCCPSFDPIQVEVDATRGGHTRWRDVSILGPWTRGTVKEKR